MKSSRSNKGFTLIELAVTLVAIGILLAIGTAMVGPLMEGIKKRETAENISSAVESLNGSAAGNNTLPNVAGFPAVAKASQDAWGRPLIYLYDASLFSATPTKDTICGRRSTALSFTTANPVATINNIAFLITSSGDDRTFQTSLNGNLNGTAFASPLTVSGFATGTITQNPADPTDILKWVTLDELRTKVGCQGPQLKIVNNELPFGAVPNAYSATITADGGVPFSTGPNTYKWCVSTLPTGFTQTGGKADANCLGLTEASWAAASSSLVISFPAASTTTGTYQLTVVVRDFADNLATSPACNNAAPGDNCAQKVFVVTVNPS